MAPNTTTHFFDQEDRSNPIWFANDGRRISSTNYWDSPFARQGLCYLSGNAGDWRLLIPSGLAEAIREFRAVKSAMIEPSIVVPGHVDIVAQDGTNSPYCVSIDRRLIDRRIRRIRCRLLVYAEATLINNIPVKVD